MRDSSQAPAPPAGLRLARVMRGLTQDQVATATSIDQAMISRAERGFRVSPIVRRKIAEMFDLPEAALFHGPGEGR